MSAQYISQLKLLIEQVVKGAKQTVLLQQLKEIEILRKNKVLKIAVIGEFSSGKSTFINALLGCRLLKEGVCPTTAAATYLRTDIQSTGLKLEVAFNNKRTFRVKEDTPPHHLWGSILYWLEKFCRWMGWSKEPMEELRHYLLTTYSTPVSSVKETIQIITSQQNIAKDINRIDIGLPRQGHIAGLGTIFGPPEDILLIDTPGFNPGQQSVENHLEVTKQVVENEADLAIILTPAGQAMSNTLVAFMANSISEYLHRCIFVITKADQLSSVAERKSVQSYVLTQLEGKFNLKKPAIFCVASRCSLPVKKLPEEIKPLWEDLGHSFQSFKKEMWHQVNIARQKTVAEHALRLMVNVAKAIAPDIQSIESQLFERKKFIESNKVARIETSTQEMVQRAKQRLQRKFAQIDYSYYSTCDSCTRECTAIIRRGGRLRNFQNNEGPKVQSKIKEYITIYRENVTRQLSPCSVEMKNILASFDREFREHYKDMPALRPKQNYQTQLPIPGDISINVSKMNRDMKCIQDNTPVTVPIFGKIKVSAELADLLSIFWKPDEHEIQDNFIQKLTPEIRQTFTNAQVAVKKQGEEHKESLYSYLDALASVHIKEYAGRVERLIAEQERQLQKTQQEYSAIMAKKASLDNIQQKIQSEIQTIKFS